MRYVGAAALSLAALLTAFTVNLRRRRRVVLLRKLSEFFGAFAALSELSPRNAAATAGKIAESESFGALGFLKPFSCRCGDADVRRVWREETSAFSGVDLLTREQRDCLTDFSEQFGLTPLEKFAEGCRRYEAVFAGFASEELRRTEKNGSVTFGTGILAAALILIVCW